MGGLGVISFVAIDAWARRHDVTGDDFQWLVSALAALTGAQLKHESAERDKRQPQKPQR